VPLRQASRRTDWVRGLFIEVDQPERAHQTDPQAWNRWRIFDHLGFRRVDVPYVQPPLAEDKSAADYLDLMFVPWDDAVRALSHVPAGWVLNTALPIWRS
jgi:hypothetical protein